MATKLTKEEDRAIQELRLLARRWPASLWLFSASGTLCVMKKKNGERVMTGGAGSGFDSNYAVAQIDIDNDGGDW